MATKSAKQKAAEKAAARHNAPQTEAALPGTSVAKYDQSMLPANFKPTRALQLPTLVMKAPGVGAALAFLSNLEVSKVPPVKKEEAYATVATVANIETGEQSQFLVPAVVESTLLQTYAPEGMDTKPDKHDYEARRALYAATELRNRVFYIRNDGKKKPTQRHVDFTVLEGESLKQAPAGE